MFTPGILLRLGNVLTFDAQYSFFAEALLYNHLTLSSAPCQNSTNVKSTFYAFAKHLPRIFDSFQPMVKA